MIRLLDEIKDKMENSITEFAPNGTKCEESMIGKKYGKLTVLEFQGFRYYKCGARGRLWKCICDCGKEITVTQHVLRRGTSCGCEKKKLLVKAITTHGGRRTRLYGVWCSMKSRCKNQHTKSYKNYGGRGIDVCKEWNDFSVFRQWALDNGYKEGLTIERINVNGNYEPSNCKWIPPYEQARNKTNNRILIYKGRKYTLQELANEKHIDRRMITSRIKRGWSVEMAVDTPPFPIGYNGHN